MFPSISPKQSFPALESEILAYWKANNTFQKSIESRPEDNPYRFYDGPPFITGTPHYGSLLSSIVKDVVGRYWTMRGKRVDRIWGWDCHGLPIEEKVQKKLGLSSNKEIEERGVKEFIDGCYEYTASTSAEWTWYIDKIGRWVDMDRAYRTMDQDYMESVMWVFKRLWDQGLIYEGKRVSLYSWKLGTPISNFEVAMDDTYQEVNDPAVTVKFRPEFTYGSFAFVTNNEGKLLLGKHKKSGTWKIPGGKFEGQETKEQCLEREVFEETGIKISNYIPLNTSVEFFEGVAYYGYAFKADAGNITSIKNPEPEKFEEWKFFTLDEVRAMKGEIAKYDHEALEVFLGEREPILEIRDFSVLAWTTTPWTIPANMALAVRNDIDYVLVENNQEQFIVAKNRAESVFKGKGEYSVIRELKGSDLVGLSYIPPFPEYYHKKNGDKNHRIYHADFITDTDGTGIGHEAPEFGDVDFGLAKKEGIFISEAMDEAGKYTSQIFDYEGLHYQEANKINIERMKENGTLFKNESITHRVPFCPRSGTPLVQKAQKSWFIDIQSQKDKLLAANEQINWFPEHLKHGRFAKGIESAPDWCISRTRYWGAPMPVWQNKDGSERVVVSSREEIYEMNKPYGQLTKIIFVRHREGEHNVKDINDCKNQYSLTEKGKQDAIILANELEKFHIDAIYSSPFTRCQQTITPLAEKKKLEIITDERIKEIDSGKWNGKKSPQGGDKFDNTKLGETGESHIDCYDRVSNFLKEIIKKHTGETIIICSHGDPLIHMKQFLHPFDYNDEKIQKKLYPKKEGFEVDYVFSDSCTPFNLHKPYIDSVILANQNAEKAKKVLGIHGWTSRGLKSGEDGFWAFTKETLEKEGIIVDVPDFDKNKETTYSLWKNQLDTLDMSSYDTIVAHSLGCAIAMEYILENKLSLKRLVLVAPSGLVGNEYLEKILPEIKGIKSELKKYVSEIIILHSKDDDAVSAKYEYGKNLAEEIGATLVTVDGFGHALAGNGARFVSELTRTGAPLLRIPEVLDVWMDSGSMPYAQMHYPFENKGEMEASFPADFIAEYVGQVRAWFYVMHVLGVLVNPNNESKPTPSFTNVITTGVINGNDGRKMSKSYGNYPDPRETIEKYGADPIRFYMLNSPLLSGGDMDFKEEQIIETVKGVMLPLWNTYSFFTTYANIDNWTPDTTEIWCVRHGETTTNESKRVNGGGMDTSLTEKGITQARERGRFFRENGIHFDLIVTTSKIRTKQTAQYIAEELGYSGEYIEIPEFNEQSMGEFEGADHEGLRQQWIDKHGNDIGWTRIYRENNEEPYKEFINRVERGIQKLRSEHKGKKILIVAHGGTGRALSFSELGYSYDDSIVYFPALKNGEYFKLPTSPIVNPLDRWILSKLQVLMGQVHDAMDGYDISRACRAIVDYMDHLTNWYVRLSRRRFWESGMTNDKESAYATLHTTLVEVSKLLAPYMPFLAESIFQGLTKKESVHLEYATFPQKQYVSHELNRDMEKCERIVSLGLALRSRKNIRVRQPLNAVTITEELSEYYEQIIKDELNVKNIKKVDPTSLAKKIAKPDAKKIGPKYGKNVQEIITKAKNGEFEEIENGIKIGDYILEAGEYTMEYLPLNVGDDVEGGYGMVVALDTNITEELKLEGYARDIIRTIQDMRKEVGYQVTDRIQFSMSGENIRGIVDLFGPMIAEETLGTLVETIGEADMIKNDILDDAQDLEIHIKKL